MYQAIIVIHILLGLGIIGLILMQQGKGADAGATFGGGASGSVFGAQGAASFLSRTTAILATMFFVTSLGLAWLNGNKTTPAADFMATPAVEKESSDSGLPNVGNAALKESLPMPPQADGKESTVVVPPAPAGQPVTAAPAPPAAADRAPVQEVVPQADNPVVEEKESEIKEEPKKAEPVAKKAIKKKK